MALAQIYSAVPDDVITAARWNNEFGNIYANGTDLAFPLTKAVSLAGFTLTLDAAAVSTLSSSASQAFQISPGSKSGVPGINGSFFNLAAGTFEDTDTAASGTATQWSSTTFRAPTLQAANASVVTTDAATVTISDAPTAGTNETLTNAWALRVVAGKTRLGGAVSIGGDVTIAGVSTISSKAVWFAESAAVASDAGGTTNIWTTDGNTVHITGTNTITSLGTAPQAGAWKLVIFDGALTLTHGANVNLPGSANITTAADDIMLVYADTTAQFDIAFYTKKSGVPIGAPTAAQGSSLVFIESQDLTSDNVFDNLGSTYDEHIFQLIGVRPGTDGAELLMTLSPDNGVSYANSGYETSEFGSQLATTTSVRLTLDQSNVAAQDGCYGTVTLYKPHGTAIQKFLRYSLGWINDASATKDSHGVSRCNDTAPDVVANAINAVKFAFSTGTIANGTIRHYGVKNS
jgi:hypothetical protein